jgi:outer membrane protein assembly factor BamD
MRRLLALLLLASTACHHGRPAVAPAPVAVSASPAEVDALWKSALGYFRAGNFAKSAKILERLVLEFAPGDGRAPEAHFVLAECRLAQGDHLQATREFRKVSDDTPNDALAPEALLRAGDAYAELWRRPELDPTYGQTALATYQELQNRYPGSDAAERAKTRTIELQDKFAYKTYRAGLFYFRIKAYDSAILYLKSVAATYPRAAITPVALIKLVEAYRILGYQEDLKETCGYLRRFHPDAAGVTGACPAPPAGAT